MTLADLRIDGRIRRVLMQANKNGFFYVLDRQTGKLISAQPFARVTWATGVDLRSGRPVEAPNARYGLDGLWLSPRPFGAHNWLSMSYNPNTGLVYIPAENSNSSRAGTIRAMPFGSRVTAPKPPPGEGYLLAWDPVRQQERWRVRQPLLGTLTTAGNLVFALHGGEDKFRAYHAATGAELWASDAVPGIQNYLAGNPITYMLDGKQYVALITRSFVVAFTLDGRAPMPAALPAG